MSCWKLSYDEQIYKQPAQSRSKKYMSMIKLTSVGPSSPALWQWDVGVDQKGGEPIARIWEEGSPNDMRPENRKWCLQEKVQPRTQERVWQSNVLNVTRANRLRYAGHMTRRPEALPQKVIFRAKPIRRKNQGRPKSRWVDGVDSDSLALGVRDLTHCAHDRQSWRDLFQQLLTWYWL
jgi:hypothetical protein